MKIALLFLVVGLVSAAPLGDEIVSSTPPPATNIKPQNNMGSNLRTTSYVYPGQFIGSAIQHPSYLVPQHQGVVGRAPQVAPMQPQGTGFAQAGVLPHATINMGLTPVATQVVPETTAKLETNVATGETIVSQPLPNQPLIKDQLAINNGMPLMSPGLPLIQPQNFTGQFPFIHPAAQFGMMPWAQPPIAPASYPWSQQQLAAWHPWWFNGGGQSYPWNKNYAWGSSGMSSPAWAGPWKSGLGWNGYNGYNSQPFYGGYGMNGYDILGGRNGLHPEDLDGRATYTYKKAVQQRHWPIISGWSSQPQYSGIEYGGWPYGGSSHYGNGGGGYYGGNGGGYYGNGGYYGGWPYGGGVSIGSPYVSSQLPTTTAVNVSPTLVSSSVANAQPVLTEYVSQPGVN